jgi:dTMP kinase
MAFITLEGPEGSGKSTQLRMLADWMEERGLPFVVTREPGGTVIGDQIRDVIVSMENQALVPEAELLLFSASRAQLVRERIRPALAAGRIVLCDRYADATMAYQGYAHGLPLAALETITTFATGGLRPTLTFLLDIEPEIGLRRRRDAAATGAEWNRLDDQVLAFHNRVRQGYLALVRAEPERWRVVDASQRPADVQSILRRHLEDLLPLNEWH